VDDLKPEPKWYAKRGDREIGPMELGKLRELASLGRLKASDRVRQSSETECRMASAVLQFPEPQAAKPNSPAPPPLPSEVANSQPQAVPSYNFMSGMMEHTKHRVLLSNYAVASSLMSF